MKKNANAKEKRINNPEQITHTSKCKDRNGQPLIWGSYPKSSRLYFEAHITVPPLSEKDSAKLDQLCKGTVWHRSSFELHKHGQVPNGFVSARAPTRDEILQAMATMLAALQQADFTVLRFKIEDTLLDSNRGDTLQLATTITQKFPEQAPLAHLSTEQAPVTA